MKKNLRNYKVKLLFSLLFLSFLSYNVTAQEYRYRTTDQKYYLKFVSAGDTWSIYTAESGGTWVSCTTLYADNNSGYYKCKSNRTGYIFEVWISQTNIVTMIVQGEDGQDYTWLYYPYE